MSILRLWVISGFIETSYGVRRFLEVNEVAQAVALLESGNSTLYHPNIGVGRFKILGGQGIDIGGGQGRAEFPAAT